MSHVVPFKGREIDVNSQVEIYRNLHKKGVVFSVRQKGVVVAHVNKFCLLDCKFAIRESGRQEFLKTGVKNVHAWVKGSWVSFTDIPLSFSWGLCYDIHNGVFTDFGKQMKLKTAKCVYHVGNQTKFQL